MKYYYFGEYEKGKLLLSNHPIQKINEISEIDRDEFYLVQFCFNEVRQINDVDYYENIYQEIKDDHNIIINPPQNAIFLGNKLEFYSRFKNQLNLPKTIKVSQEDNLIKVINEMPEEFVVFNPIDTGGYNRFLFNQEIDSIDKIKEILEKSGKIGFSEYCPSYSNKYQTFFMIRFLYICGILVEIIPKINQTWNVHFDRDLTKINPELITGLNQDLEELINPDKLDSLTDFVNHNFPNDLISIDTGVYQGKMVIYEFGWKSYDNNPLEVYQQLGIYTPQECQRKIFWFKTLIDQIIRAKLNYQSNIV